MRAKLWVLKRLLWRADALICSLPAPAQPTGSYFETWSRLGSVHGAISKLPSERVAAMTGTQEPPR